MTSYATEYQLVNSDNNYEVINDLLEKFPTIEKIYIYSHKSYESLDQYYHQEIFEYRYVVTEMEEEEGEEEEEEGEEDGEEEEGETYMDEDVDI